MMEIIGSGAEVCFNAKFENNTIEKERNCSQTTEEFHKELEILIIISEFSVLVGIGYFISE